MAPRFAKLFPLLHPEGDMADYTQVDRQFLPPLPPFCHQQPHYLPCQACDLVEHGKSIIKPDIRRYFNKK